MHLITDPPKYLFFTGKGGVGKTSIACATAVYLADNGKRVLLVSTDPASNVAQVLGLTIGNSITAVVSVPGLSALEIDPEAAAEAYRERIIAPVRGLLPEREIASITEQLSGSCTTEVASFNEFTELLANDGLTANFDHVIFDTAPTGHTIRLLQLPGSWTDFLDAGKGDASCLGPLAGLDKQRSTYASAVATLQDATRTRLVLVTRAQSSALNEIARTLHELNAIGIHTSQIVLNGLLPDSAGGDLLATSIRERERAAIANMPPEVAALPRDSIELKSDNMVGPPALRRLFRSADHLDVPTADSGNHGVVMRSLGSLVDEIETDGPCVVLCMGKGGVGKTTIATAIALALADRGNEVHLTTTDPAAHLTETLHANVEHLRVSRIDPESATAEYREHIMATRGKSLDAMGRANLTEDLLSPCTEEVAVFQQFARAVLQAQNQYVIIDTAPTGHTLLLIDATGSYHRDVARQAGTEGSFRTAMMVLQDPTQAKVILVTLPEPTPVTEAAGLQVDLQRAGISPWAWVVNNSLAAAEPDSVFLRQRAANESDHLAAVAAQSHKVALVALQNAEPTGAELLLRLTKR